MVESSTKKIKLGKKVKSEADFIKDASYTNKKSLNSWQLITWNNDEVFLWSNNNSTVSRRFKKTMFIKNWYFSL